MISKFFTFAAFLLATTHAHAEKLECTQDIQTQKISCNSKNYGSSSTSYQISVMLGDKSTLNTTINKDTCPSFEWNKLTKQWVVYSGNAFKFSHSGHTTTIEESYDNPHNQGSITLFTAYGIYNLKTDEDNCINTLYFSELQESTTCLKKENNKTYLNIKKSYGISEKYEITENLDDIIAISETNIYMDNVEKRQVKPSSYVFPVLNVIKKPNYDVNNFIRKFYTTCSQENRHEIFFITNNIINQLTYKHNSDDNKSNIVSLPIRPNVLLFSESSNNQEEIRQSSFRSKKNTNTENGILNKLNLSSISHKATESKLNNSVITNPDRTVESKELKSSEKKDFSSEFSLLDK